MRRALVAVTALVVLVSAFTLLTSGPADAKRKATPTREWRALTHNIAGGALHRGDPVALTEVENQIESFNPHIVLLQEVCGSQLEWFKAQHPDWYFTAAVKRYEHPGCPAPDVSLYDVVASKAAQVEQEIVHIYDEPNAARTGDLPCATVRLWYSGELFPVRSCSAHFPVGWADPDGDLHRAAVANTMAHLQGYMSQGTAVIWGGDLNAQPSPRIQVFYDRMVEADDPQNEPTTGDAVNGTKIDYLFFKHLIGWDIKVADASSGRTSDHRLFKMRVTDS